VSTEAGRPPAQPSALSLRHRGAAEQAWRQLRDQSDAIADSITLTLFERDEEIYDRFGAELRADVRQSTREHIRRGISVLAGRRELLDQAQETWRETGRRRARQGVPLELVLNAYTTGARILWEALVARAGLDPSTGPDADGDEGGEPQEDSPAEAAMLIRAARAVWSNLDHQNRVLIESYRREAARLQRQDLQRQQAAIDALLEGRGADPEFAPEAREALGLGAEDPVACVVVLSDEPTVDALGPAEDGLDQCGVRAFWHLRGGVHLGLLAGPLPGEDELVSLFEAGRPGRVGLALCPEGMAGFAAAFQLATRAAESLPPHEHGVVSVGERLPEVLLAGSPQLVPLLMSQTLGPLLAQPDAQSRTLLDTLAALLRHDGSPTHAAEELYCHRNTVIYRMRQIEDLTGRSLSDPRDKLLLGLAVLARRGQG